MQPPMPGPPRQYGHMYRQPLPAQQNGLGHGIINFIDQFRQAQRSKKEQAKQDFYQDIQLLSQGIPVDIEKAAKKARKAGLDFDFEGPTPEIIKQQEAQQQAMAQQQQMPAPPQPGMGGNPLMNLGRRMGIVPPTGKIPQGAGIYQMLSQIEKQGRRGQESQALVEENRIRGQKALKAFLDTEPGSPENMAAARTLSVLGGENALSPQMAEALFQIGQPEVAKKLNARIMELNASKARTTAGTQLMVKFPDQAADIEKWMQKGGDLPVQMPEKEGDAWKATLELARIVGPEIVQRMPDLVELYQTDQAGFLALSKEIADSKAMTEQQRQEMEDRIAAQERALNTKVKQAQLESTEVTTDINKAIRSEITKDDRPSRARDLGGIVEQYVKKKTEPESAGGLFR